MTKTGGIENLRAKLKIFAQERNWEQYHTPKNLAMALTVECSELLEIFQWQTQEQSMNPDDATKEHIREEIGDIMIYLTMIAASFDIDPVDAAMDKLALNRRKYPVP